MLKKSETAPESGTLSASILIYAHPTPLGIALITEVDGFITAVSITDSSETQNGQPGLATLQTIQQLDEYFAGKRLVFDLPLKQAGTDFQQTVWQQLLRIEYGKTITYGKQSQKMSSPLAIRAIAAANGKNKLWIIVPCHRVIGANGNLTGYVGGLWRKKWLLEHEAKVLGKGQLSIAL